MELSLGAAAKMAGMNKTTLSRHIKVGRLSARRADDGSYAIDASELARAYELRLLRQARNYLNASLRDP